MSKQSRIGLLISLVFIVAFAVVLSEFWVAGDSDSPATQQRKDRSFYAQSPVINTSATARRTPMPRPRHMRSARRRTSRQERYARSAAARTVPVSARRESTAVAVTEPRQAPGIVYVVKAGDNLTRIARSHYGRDKGGLYTKIFEANRDVLADAGTVRVGMKLKIPKLGGSPVSASPAGVSGRRTVRASGFREMSIEELARAHHVEVPSAPARDQTPQHRKIHVVQRGDNLTTIARKYLDDASRAAVTKIIEANRDKISDPDHLVIGMKLYIPA